MSATTASLHHQAYQHPAALYPVVEDITDLEYSCCPCDANDSILERFPLRDIAFPLAQPTDASGENAEKKGHHRRGSSSSSSSLLFRRRSSRGSSSFDDEVTVNTEQEDNVAKFQDTFVLTRQVRTQNLLIRDCLRSNCFLAHVCSLVSFLSDFCLHSVSGLGVCS